MGLHCEREDAYIRYMRYLIVNEWCFLLKTSRGLESVVWPFAMDSINWFYEVKGNLSLFGFLHLKNWTINLFASKS